MSSQRMTRRGFLARTSTTPAALGIAGLASSRAYGANERITIGIIGTGNRGTALIKNIISEAKANNVEVTAVCDVWKVNLGKAASLVQKHFGKSPQRFTRFGELLERGGVDAVVIATPDFGHTPILIEALKAGKDAYVEKPMSLEIDAANQALDLARAGKRVVQCGTQHRSEGTYRAATKVVATGALGQISRISASMAVNSPRWARGYDDCKESDVDWDAYLFNRPQRPFDAKLLRRWHLYRMCTNGLSGLWMSHYADAVHMLTGAKYPVRVTAGGGTFVWKDGREHCDTFHALLEYPEGFLMDWSMGLANSAGIHFTVHGTEGTLDAHHWSVSGAGGRKGTKVTSRKLELEPNISHMGNWLECLRSRERPNADIQFGHQHAVATIMAATALHTGQRQQYDTGKRLALAG